MNNTRLLVVEDDPDMQDFLREALPKVGYSVLDIVSSGEEAIAKISEGRPDCILMDIYLAGKKNGITTVKEINQYSEIPIIFMTGKYSSNIFEEAKRTNPHGFLIKPFGFLELFTTIETILNRDTIEKKMQTSELQFRLLAESSLDLVFRIDITGVFTYCSPSVTTFLGYTVDEVIGTCITEYLTEQVKTNLELPFKDLADMQTLFMAEVPIIHKNGKRVIAQINAVPIELNSSLYIQGTARDITESKRIEEGLLETVRKSQMILNTVDDGITLSDENGYFEIFNTKMENITGYTIDDANKKGNFLSLIYPDKKEYNKALSGITRARVSKDAHIVETTITTRDDVKKVLDVSTSIIFLNNQNWFLSVYHDVSNRKKAEEKLHENEQMLDQIFHLLPAALRLIDLNHTIIKSNTLFSELCSTDSRTVIGQKCFSVFNTGYCDSKKCSIRCLTSGENYIEHNITKEIHNEGKQYFKLIAVPLKNADGKTSSILEIFTDISKQIETDEKLANYNKILQDNVLEKTKELREITENLLTELEHSKQVEMLLREKEEKYSLLTETTKEIILTYNKHGEITFVNLAAEKIFNIPREKIFGMKFKEIYNDIEKKEMIVRYPDENDNKILFEHIINKEDGTTIFLESTSTPFKVNDELYETLIVSRDVSEYKNAEETIRFHEKQLMLADKMASLGVLISGIAHEINNPNTFILLNSQIIRDIWNETMNHINDTYDHLDDLKISGIPFAELSYKMQEILTGLTDGSHRIKNIINNLKAFIQPQNNNWNSVIDVNLVVKSAILIMNNLIIKSTDNFIVNFGNDIPLLRGNFQMLEQVVINLLVNSCQALQDKKSNISIIISYDTEDGYVTINVTDEGIGIPEEHMNKIMDPFFTTKQNLGGTGLGLSISYSIIEKFSGQFYFDSQVDRGTTATIKLPVTKPEE